MRFILLSPPPLSLPHEPHTNIHCSTIFCTPTSSPLLHPISRRDAANERWIPCALTPLSSCCPGGKRTSSPLLIVPPAPAGAFALRGMRGSSTPFRRSRGSGSSGAQRRADGDTYGKRAGDIYLSNGIRPAGSTAVAVGGTSASGVGTRMRMVGEGSPRGGNATTARTAMVGDGGSGSDGDGGGGGGDSKPFAHAVGKKKAVHRLVFMRHAESEWNRCGRVAHRIVTYSVSPDSCILTSSRATLRLVLVDY